MPIHIVFHRNGPGHSEKEVALLFVSIQIMSLRHRKSTQIRLSEKVQGLFFKWLGKGFSGGIFCQIGRYTR